MSQDPKNPPIRPARIEWQDATPVSSEFGDLYFSRDDGAAESRYVFIHQNHLEQRWQAWDQPGSFVIGETGFGTGLNVLCAWDLWRQMRKPGQHLHVVSVEKFPLSKHDLEQANALQPALASLSRALLDQYPPLVRGSHRLHFPADNFSLTLLFDDAIGAFTALLGQVDAWFLDGFAPSCNPDMWQPELFRQLARLSHPGTTFATFTAAGDVRRGLRDAGFQVEKCQGYGRKRDMLRGFLPQTQSETAPTEPSDSSCGLYPPAQQPWSQFTYQRTAPGHAAIIGAGLAGCSVARKLADRGWQVTVFEADTDIATQASGNPTGITYTKLSRHDSPQNRYYQFAYLYACRFIRTLFQHHGVEPGQDWNLNGVLQLGFDEATRNEQQALMEAGLWPDDVVQSLEPKAVAQHLGVPCDHPALLMTQGGWLNPASLCRVLLDHPGIHLITGTRAGGLTRRGLRWHLDGVDTGFDAVVLANTFAATESGFADHLPLRQVRGQITYVPATAESMALQRAVNYDGYINPARDGFHCVGATFNPRDRETGERPDDHAQNLAQLAQALPALANNLPRQQDWHGRVGFRCQTPDYLPVVGPLPDIEAFEATYADIGKGFLKRDFPPCPNLPGLYISTAFGAKGITGAPLAAEMLAAYISGEPQPLDPDVVFALHPARFLIRALKRRQR